MLISRHFGKEWVYTWETIGKLQNQDILLDSFEKGFFQLILDVPIYFTTYQYNPTILQIPLWASQFWLIGFALTTALLSAAATSFRRVYFLGASTLLIVLMISLRTDLIGIGGLYSKWWINSSLVLVFAGLNYYFHSFGKHISFLKKFLANGLLWTTLVVLVFFSAREANPSVYLAGFGMPIPALLCIATIFLVATELPFFFASLTATHSLTGKLNFKSFHLIMLFYVGNLVLLYLKNTKVLVLDIIYLDDFYILAVALILGLWGTRYNPLFCLIVPEKLRTWVYAALVANVGITVAYFHSIANEAAIAALEDFIVYSFLGFGIVFWVYTLVNFRGDQSKHSKTPFWQIFYEFQAEKTIPLYLARGMGFFVMGLFIYKENALVLKQSIAAYLGGVADAYLLHHNTTNAYLANDYYEKALSYDPLNHRFWYGKIALLNKKGNLSDQEIASKITMLELASQRDPQAQDYAHIAQAFLESEQELLASLEYKEALEKFPENPYLNSNLAMLLAKQNIMDSALYYLQKSEKLLPNISEKEANFLSLLIRKPIIPFDSLRQYLQHTEDRFYEINRLALLTVYQKWNEAPLRVNFARKNLDDTTTLGQVQAAYLYNYLAASKPKDTTALYLSHKLLNTQANLAYSEWLNLARKIYFFRNYLHQQGIETARYLNFISATDYQFLYAKYLLYLGESEKAAKELDKLKANAFSSYPYQEVLMHTAIAHSEARNENLAKATWQKVVENASAEKVKIAQKMLQIYDFKPEKWQEADDTLKFGLVYYRNISLKEQTAIAKNIKNIDLRVKAISFLMEKWLEKQDIQTAENLFETLPKDIETSLDVQTGLNVAYLKLLYQKNDKQQVAEILDKLPLSKRCEPYRFFFKAWLMEENKAEEARKMYTKAIEGNPFDLYFYPAAIALENKLSKPQDKGFDWAIQAMQFKPENVEAWEIYFNQCLAAEFWDFIPSALEKIKELAPEIYPRYKAIFEEKKR
ncbi:MAG: hypothetical protein OHK0045_05890 [Raineya sp.]